MEKVVKVLINRVRQEIEEFLSEVNGPKEEKARDKMITELLEAANDAEVDAHYTALGEYYNSKMKINRKTDKYVEDMSSAEITAEAEATYGQLHN